MDGSDPARPGRGGRALLATGVVLVFLAVVTVASSRDVVVGAGAARRPSELILDTVITLLLVAMAMMAVVLVVGVVLGRGFVAEEAGGIRRRRWHAVSLLVFALLLGFLLLNVRARSNADPARLPGLLPDQGGAVGGDGAKASYDPEFATVPLLIVAGIACAAVVAWWLSRRARRAALPPPPLQEALLDVLDETVDDLRSLSDPRAAVIAAYSRLERALAAAGHPRLAAEAPEEYLQRILVEAEVSAEPASRLTTLFATAKFSSHDVEATMKDDAIDALVTVRDELREAEERREQARREALTIAREQAAGS